MRQAGAIPYRWRGQELEFLLITSRSSGRWIVPKGMLDPGMSPQQQAALEAWEEAGVRGQVEEWVGQLGLTKWGKAIRLDLYLLRVDSVESDWQESGFRLRRWFAAQQAMRQVEMNNLDKVLAKAIDLVRLRF